MKIRMVPELKVISLKVMIQGQRGHGARYVIQKKLLAKWLMVKLCVLCCSLARVQLIALQLIQTGLSTYNIQTDSIKCFKVSDVDMHMHNCRRDKIKKSRG